MAFTIGEIELNGPVADPSSLENKAGLFVLLASKGSSDEVIDFGYAKDVKAELVDTDGKTFKVKLKEGTPRVGVLYTDDNDHADKIVETIEKWYDEVEVPTVSVK